MEHNQILDRVADKITRLGEARKDLERQLGRLKEENAAMHRINKELQAQIDEMIEKSSEQLKARTLSPAPDENVRGATRQRINELVQEIDECITLLNK
jgi:hypothetical protein